MRISDWSSDVCSSDLLSCHIGNIYCVSISIRLGARHRQIALGGIMFRSFRSVFKFALLAASALSLPAFAQDAVGEMKDDDGNGRKDEAIVVYGSGIDLNTAAPGLDLPARATPQPTPIPTPEKITKQT